MAVPRITIVTSSFNQAAFIGRTIDSVIAQNYPNLEHIVVDGMSSDDTPAVLARYPHLTVIREPDRGQADAINKGFGAATERFSASSIPTTPSSPARCTPWRPRSIRAAAGTS
jgi:glycosyltransferase involved in cell wall biosynthesis